jgi:hypothetical protein
MKHGNDLSSPMTNMFPQPSKGGEDGGDKEGWGVMQKLGAPAAAVDEPVLQIIQDVGPSLDGRVMSPTMGTADKVDGDKR